MTDDVNGGGFLNQGYKAPDELEMFTEEFFSPVPGMVSFFLSASLIFGITEMRRSNLKFGMNCLWMNSKIKLNIVLYSHPQGWHF